MTCFSYNSQASLLMLFATLMASAVVQSFARPFTRRRDNLLDIASMIVLTATFELGVLGLDVPFTGGADRISVFVDIILASMC